MNKLACKKGVTLIEVILAIGIFAAVAFPLISVFVQSVNIDKKASDVLNANYIAQEYVEKLDGFTYEQALSLPTDLSIKDYSLSTKIIPYGTQDFLFSDRCSYVHVILSDTGALCVFPDGKWKKFTSIPSTFSLTLADKTYTFKGGSTTITGTSKYYNIALLVNAMRKPDTALSAFTLQGNCKAAFYCKTADAGEITFSGGSCTVYKDMFSGNKSLVYVTTALYNASKVHIIATSDSYISIKNWN